MFLRRNKHAGGAQDGRSESESTELEDGSDAAASDSGGGLVAEPGVEEQRLTDLLGLATDADVSAAAQTAATTPDVGPSVAALSALTAATATAMPAAVPPAPGATEPARPARPHWRDNPGNGDLPSVLSRGVIFEGRIRTTGSLHLEGRIEGTLEAPLLTLGETGTITGEIHCRQATVNGTVDGTFECGSLEVGPTAMLSGTVRCNSMSLSMGAVINATVEIVRA